MPLSLHPPTRWRSSLAPLILLLVAAGGHATTTGTTTGTGAGDDFLYTVQPGDSAWTVTTRYLRDPSHWEGLRRTNQLRGDRLRPGQVLRIPTPWLRLSTPQARLAALRGEVMLNSGAGWVSATADTVLPAGTWLRTAATGTATLLLQDGTRILVRPASELRMVPVDKEQVAAWVKAQIAAPDATAPVRIELLRGGLESTVQPQPGVDRFEVRTPTAVTTVRGTEFRITTEGDGSRAEVVHGAVGFGNPQGTVALSGATGSRTTPGEAPASAVPLLPAPDLSGLPDTVQPDQFASLSIPALAGAVAYRAQWLADPPSEQMLQETRHPQALPADPGLPDGRYRLRLRGIDAAGFEGLSAEHSLRLHTPALPPPAPRLQTALTGQRLLLRWGPVAPEHASQLQVAQDADFTQLVLDEPTPHDRLDLPAPPSRGYGRYHLRVRVLQPGGGRSGWSEPRVIDPRSPQEPSP